MIWVAEDVDLSNISNKIERNVKGIIILSQIIDVNFDFVQKKLKSIKFSTFAKFTL